ncbi:hypothetical protein COUCH_35960 [Couchioplanes caeruleus]|uniref:hypothetical protein n=1 Tax=Couchioplanes caeruleus TaxID=56438 RepID=UPI0020BE359D|nr:hypothetical protein [Couchioplanes caeruleus]UQU64296.1 hypothetical protein COUCH_35960 [Couchioplanes caeruleus]
MTSAEPRTAAAVRRRPGSTNARTPGPKIPNQRRDARTTPTVSVQHLTELAGAGTLGGIVAEAGEGGRRGYYTAAYALCHPVVFDVVTRKVERRRGHAGCRRGLRHLTGPCLDAFYDDVEALVDHLLATTTPIDDLPAWLAYWAPRAAVDGHRRRRGAIGALQRPRMTATLAAGLDHDQWLMALALEILTWVGVPATAGADLWPLDEWAQRRALVTGDQAGSTPAVVAADVERVLAVMRRRPDWYADHVERPLGHKPAPVAAPPGDGVTDPRPLRAVDEHDAADAHIAVLAGTAVEAIAAGLNRPGDPAATVVRVLTSLFLGGTGAEVLDRAPGVGPDSDERLSALLTDPAAVAGIVDRVLPIVRELEP